ncbi:hypothetical protein PTSG_07099 [Salpingoeca rosetta]|uniref:PHD-type domain-containing protein n=1 Tax=Salpingoeca rosetta (strain ATCC 50818 / BSB-021) TaxID=946362 RepID=F2UE21_SALR5|nr:uncharacterized protein PTSG_07099 [Salpingoeca rosetta]EGD74871.1 hypothetical protein PTSG_07099 [Salpingoeca rosetta]|eukprot:XP_004992516.1 hypothetical protein PTSG_07099 [Salpingoeca rosetta]
MTTMTMTAITPTGSKGRGKGHRFSNTVWAQHGQGSLLQSVYVPVASVPTAHLGSNGSTASAHGMAAIGFPMFGSGGLRSGRTSEGAASDSQQQATCICHKCGKGGKRLHRCITCEKQFHRDCAEPPIRGRAAHHRCQRCRDIKTKQWAKKSSPFDILDWLTAAHTVEIAGEHMIVHPMYSQQFHERAKCWRLGHMSRS